MDDFTERTVTCRTPDCGNEGIPLTLRCLPTVFCGACGGQIFDIKG